MTSGKKYRKLSIQYHIQEVDEFIATSDMTNINFICKG